MFHPDFGTRVVCWLKCKYAIAIERRSNKSFLSFLTQAVLSSETVVQVLVYLVKDDSRDVFRVHAGYRADLVPRLGGEEREIFAVGDYHHLGVWRQGHDALRGGEFYLYAFLQMEEFLKLEILEEVLRYKIPNLEGVAPWKVPVVSMEGSCEKGKLCIGGILTFGI